MQMGPSNAFYCYMGYVGTNGAGRELFVVVGWVSVFRRGGILHQRKD